MFFRKLYLYKVCLSIQSLVLFTPKFPYAEKSNWHVEINENLMIVLCTKVLFVGKEYPLSMS